LARKLAKKSPLAVQMGKQAFYGMSDMEYAKALEYSNEMFASLCITEDGQEGVEAFLNKRSPEWKLRGPPGRGADRIVHRSIPRPLPTAATTPTRRRITRHE
jgi:hypothetical protein